MLREDRVVHGRGRRLLQYPQCCRAPRGQGDRGRRIGCIAGRVESDPVGTYRSGYLQADEGGLARGIRGYRGSTAQRATAADQAGHHHDSLCCHGVAAAVGDPHYRLRHKGTAGSRRSRWRGGYRELSGRTRNQRYGLRRGGGQTGRTETQGEGTGRTHDRQVGERRGPGCVSRNVDGPGKGAAPRCNGGGDADARQRHRVVGCVAQVNHRLLTERRSVRGIRARFRRHGHLAGATRSQHHGRGCHTRQTGRVEVQRIRSCRSGDDQIRERCQPTGISGDAQGASQNSPTRRQGSGHYYPRLRGRTIDGIQQLKSRLLAQWNATLGHRRRLGGHPELCGRAGSYRNLSRPRYPLGGRGDVDRSSDRNTCDQARGVHLGHCGAGTVPGERSTR